MSSTAAVVPFASPPAPSRPSTRYTVHYCCRSRSIADRARVAIVLTINSTINSYIHYSSMPRDSTMEPTCPLARKLHLYLVCCTRPSQIPQVWFFPLLLFLGNMSLCMYLVHRTIDDDKFVRCLTYQRQGLSRDPAVTQEKSAGTQHAHTILPHHHVIAIRITFLCESSPGRS